MHQQTVDIQNHCEPGRIIGRVIRPPGQKGIGLSQGAQNGRSAHCAWKGMPVRYSYPEGNSLYPLNPTRPVSIRPDVDTDLAQVQLRKLKPHS